MHEDQKLDKKNYQGVVREKRNYLLYEDIDETEKRRKKKEPLPFDPLDNFRYYEYLRLRDRRTRSIVTHERLSEPVGKETPFKRNSYSKYNPNNIGPKKDFGKDEKYRGKHIKSPSLYNHNYARFTPEHETFKLHHKPHQNQNQAPTNQKKLRQGGEMFILLKNERCPTCGGPRAPDAFNGGKNILRKNDTQINNKYNTNNNKLRGKKKDFKSEYYTNYKKDYYYNPNDLVEDYSNNYRYKQSTFLNKPNKYDSKALHKRRKEGNLSFENYKKTISDVDKGYSTTTLLYCPIHGYVKDFK